MNQRGFRIGVVVAAGVVAGLFPAASRGQVRPGRPGPDLSGFVAYRQELAAGAERARWSRPERGLPRILLAGFWPPTNEIIRRFSDNPVQNPGGWIGADWEGRGYDVYAFFPEFPGGPSPPCDWGRGMGDFEIDYQDTSADWWRIADMIQPIGIITFSRGDPTASWEVELNQHNHNSWFPDYAAPMSPTPNPPDAGYPLDGLRCSTLPMDDIVSRVSALSLGLNVFIDVSGDTGRFLSEFMAYHGAWYRGLHETPADPVRTLAAGHIHVGFTSCSPTSAALTMAAEESVRSLIDRLDAGQEIPPTAVVARGTGPTEVTLTWAGTSPMFQVLQRVGGCGSPATLLGQTAATTFLDTTVSLGTTYGYVIRSLDRCDRDSACIEYTHVLCDVTTLNRVTDLMAVAGPAGAVDLSWSADPAVPPEYHVNSVATKLSLTSPTRGVPGVLPVCTTPLRTCRSTPAPASVTHYQVLSACADLVGEEGPF